MIVKTVKFFLLNMADNRVNQDQDKGEVVEDAYGFFDSAAFATSLKPHLGELKNYKMNHPNRGMAIIFNHKHFKNSRYATRYGTGADVRNLINILLKLGFRDDHIIVYNDLPFLDIYNVLKEVSSEDHTNNDLFMVFVLTHGFNSDKIMAYDEDYPVEKIWSFFTADKCQSLAEKPKIFFIVACRGDSTDRGVRRIEELDGSEDPSSEVSCSVDAMAFQTSSSYVIPIWSDFLCVFSSYKGYYSYRNTEYGTWFVQAFCEHASKTDFDKISFTDFLTGVNGLIARTFQTHPFDLRKQTSVMSSTLTKLLYLTDKEEEEEKNLNEQNR